MSQAITTKFLGPTNTRGSRIKATADAGSITVIYDHRLSVDANHRAAAMALVERCGWTEPHYPADWVGGGLPGGKGYAFVIVAPESRGQ